MLAIDLRRQFGDLAMDVVQHGPRILTLGVEATTDVKHLMGKPISDSADD
jgi:hypothetical protein